MLPLYRALRNNGLDPQNVYKIREADIDREDIHLYLSDGVIGFTQSVEGRITGAIFEGDGEVLVRPPDRMERASLGLFIGQGVLDEHFTSAYLRFNDDIAKELQPYLRPSDEGMAFVSRNDASARRLAAMDAMRLASVSPAVPRRVYRITSAPARSGTARASRYRATGKRRHIFRCPGARANRCWSDFQCAWRNLL